MSTIVLIISTKPRDLFNGEITMIRIKIDVDNIPITSISIDGIDVEMKSGKKVWKWKTNVTPESTESSTLRAFGVIKDIPFGILKGLYFAGVPKVKQFTKREKTK